jgi:hypothetical protein
MVLAHGVLQVLISPLKFLLTLACVPSSRISGSTVESRKSISLLEVGRNYIKLGRNAG